MKREDGHACRRQTVLERIDALSDLLHTGKENEDATFARLGFTHDVVHNSRDKLASMSVVEEMRCMKVTHAIIKSFSAVKSLER